VGAAERLADFVVRHSKLVIAAWIVILVLSAPLAGMLDKYISYSERKWLPSSAESVKASDIVEHAAGGEELLYVVEAPHVLQRLDEAYAVLHRYFRGLGNVTTPLNISRIAAGSIKGLLNASIGAARGTANGFYGVYRAAVEAYRGGVEGARGLWMLVYMYRVLAVNASRLYPLLLKGSEEMVEGFNKTLEMTPFLERVYAEVLHVALVVNQAYHHLSWLLGKPSPSDWEAVRREAEELLRQAMSSGSPGLAATGGFHVDARVVSLLIRGAAAAPPGDMDALRLVARAVLVEASPPGLRGVVAEMLRIIDELGGPGRAPPRLVAEKLFTYMLEKGVGGFRLPPGVDPGEVVRLVEEAAAGRGAGWLAGELFRLFVASMVAEKGGQRGRVLAERIRAGLDPVVELIIRSRGRVSPGSQAFIRAVAEALAEAGAPRSLAEEIASASGPAEVERLLLGYIRGRLLEGFEAKLPGFMKPYAPLIVDEVFSSNGSAPVTVVVNATVEALTPRFSGPASLLGSMYGVEVPYREALRLGAMEALNLTTPASVSSWLDGVASRIEGVVLQGLRGSMVSRDNTTALVMVSCSPTVNSTRLYQVAMDAKRGLEGLGLRVYVLGGSVQKIETKKAIEADISIVDKLSGLMVLIVLLLTIRSLVASITPFTIIGLSVVAGTAAVCLLAMTGVSVTSWARSLMVTTALGLGIDYTAYILSRLREELAKGGDPGRAVYRALKTSIPGVAGSAVTDFLGFASFLLAWDMPFLQSLGFALPPVVAAVALASVTLAPAILVHLASRKWFWWPHTPEKARAKKPRPPIAARFAAAKPLAALTLLALLAVPAAYTVATFHGSYDVKLFMPSGSEVARGVTLLEEKLSPGKLYPLYIIVEHGNETICSMLHESESLAEAITAAAPGSTVYGPSRPSGKEINITAACSLPSLAERITERYTINKTMYYLRVELPINPMTSKGLQVAQKVHDKAHQWAHSHNTTVLVGGVPATINELNNAMQGVFWGIVLPVAVACMAISMLAVFHCWSAAIIPLISVALGVGYAILTSNTLFNTLGVGGLLWFLPTVTAVAALGVGMDYNSFYINRAIEEAEKMPSREAALEAAARVAGLVVGLSLIVSSSYSAMVLTHSWGFREIGLTLALAIFYTSIIAVLLLWPSILSLIGDKAWWPRKPRRGTHIEEQ